MEVIHINVTNFMAAIEEIISPSLKDRPILIAKEGSSRAVVYDLSAESYRAGVRRGMFLRHAEKLISDAAILPPRPEIYRRAEAALYHLTCEYSPIVEQHERGHIFIDATGTRSLFGPPADLAAKIKREIKNRLSLLPVTTHAANKIVAKVASRVVKPDGFASIIHGDEAPFLGPQHITMLPGIGIKLNQLLSSLGVETMGILAALPQTHAATILGKKAPKLQELAQGIDRSPVINSRTTEKKIVINEILPEDTIDRECLETYLFKMVEDAGIRLRIQQKAAAKITLTLEYCDDRSYTYGTLLPKALFTDRSIFSTTTLLLEKLLHRRVRIKRMQLILSKLTDTFMQLDLFQPEQQKKDEQIQHTIDAIRQRYGLQSIKFAKTLQVSQ